MSYDKRIYYSVLDKIVGYIAYQPRTEYEVSKKLKVLCESLKLDSGDKAELTNDILKELKEDGCIDDTKYIKNYIQGQTDSRKKSLIKMKTFLSQKGLDRDLIDGLCNSVEKDYEVDTAVGLAEKKLRSLSGQPYEVKKRKLASYLAGKGFNSHAVFNAVDMVLGVK